MATKREQGPKRTVTVIPTQDHTVDGIELTKGVPAELTPFQAQQSCDAAGSKRVDPDPEPGELPSEGDIARTATTAAPAKAPAKKRAAKGGA